MSLISPADLVTELYPEVIDEITRTSEKEQKDQIKAAEDFAKAYLFKYDLKALFGDTGLSPTVDDEALKKCVKIIAAYFLVRKANPNVNLGIFREDYELMVGTKEEPGWLEMIRNGDLNPAWPYKADDPNTPEDESTQNSDVYWTSTKQRVNRF